MASVPPFSTLLPPHLNHMIPHIWPQLIGRGEDTWSKLGQLAFFPPNLELGSRNLLSFCGCLNLLPPHTPRSRKGCSGNSLAVQWLGPCASIVGGMVPSLRGELRSRMPRGVAKKIKKKKIVAQRRERKERTREGRRG